MKLISPVLGYTLKGLCYPIEYLASHSLFSITTPDIQIIKNVAYGSHKLQKLDIYSKNSDRTDRPIVVFVHGGGWMSGDKTTYHTICQRLAAQDYVVFNINYRLAPRYLYTQQVQDIALALTWINQNCIQYQGDHQNLFLAGDTSGAHLVMSYSTALIDSSLEQSFNLDMSINIEQLKGLILFFGIFDLSAGIFSNKKIAPYFNKIFLGAKNYESAIKTASPIHFLDKKLPPIFLAAGEVDPLFSQSALLIQKLKLLKHPYVTCFFDKAQYPDAYSIFFSFLQKSYAQHALKEASLFLNFFSTHHHKTSEQVPHYGHLEKNFA